MTDPSSNQHGPTPPAPNQQAPYQRIKEDLLERVRSGIWSPGDTIPGELTLAQEFDCSRSTVHRAVRELADEGVFERRRKTGTVVSRQKGRSLSFDIPLVEDEIRNSGADYLYQLLYRKVDPLPPADAAALDRKPGDKALHLRCLHFANRRAYQYEDRWIDLNTVPEAAEVSFEQEGPNNWLVSNIPWTDAEHTIVAAAASGDVADALNLPVGDPVLVVERRTWNTKGTVTAVRFYHPGSSHRLRTRFQAR